MPTKCIEVYIDKTKMTAVQKYLQSTQDRGSTNFKLLIPCLPFNKNIKPGTFITLSIRTRGPWWAVMF